MFRKLAKMAPVESKTRRFRGSMKSEILSKLYRDCADEQVYSDVLIETGKGKIRAHRNILGSSSQYFHNMFKSSMIEGRSGVVELKHLDHEAVKIVVNYIYQSEIDISIENVFEVLRCADYMVLTELKGFCQTFLLENIDGSNCLSIRSCAKTYGLEDVLEKAQTFIVDNLASIRENNEYLELDIDDFFNLFHERSSETPETEVHKTLIQWVKHHPEEREKFFPRLMSAVDLTKLSPTYLATNVTTEPMLQQSISCKDQVIKAYEFHLGVKNDMVPDKMQKLDKYVQEEGKAVQAMLDAEGKAGDIRMLVDVRWFGRWRHYVSNNSYSSPGPIDNSTLCHDKECSQLKENLARDVDYVTIPVEAWNYLVERHGCITNQAQISFPVLEIETMEGDAILAVDPYMSERSVNLQFYNIQAPNNVQKTTFLCSTSMGQVKDQMVRQLRLNTEALGFGRQNTAASRRRFRRENGAILPDDVNLIEIGLKNGDILVWNPYFR